MLRTVPPGDLSTLLRLTARALPDQACPRERLGRGEGTLALRDLVALWMPARRGQRTFLWAQGQSMGGLLSCRGRPDLSTGEVDHLLLSTDTEDGCVAVLNHLGIQAAEAGVHRLFLRLSAESPYRESVRRAGFSSYVTEHLLTGDLRGVAREGTPALPPGLRPRQARDDYPLFRLSSRAAPMPVRLAEGLTLQEWQESMAVRWGAGRPGADLVVEREGEIVAWLRTAARRSTGDLFLVLHPEAASLFPALLRLGLQRLERRPRAFVLLPEHQSQLLNPLAEMGFEKVAEYVSFVREAATRVKSPGLVPAQVM